MIGHNINFHWLLRCRADFSDLRFLPDIYLTKIIFFDKKISKITGTNRKSKKLRHVA
jgi:hypothetical protein